MRIYGQLLVRKQKDACAGTKPEVSVPDDNCKLSIWKVGGKKQKNAFQIKMNAFR